MNPSEILLFLLSIPGIGKKTVLKLFQAFSSFPAIYAASPKELQLVLSKKQLSAFLTAREEIDPVLFFKQYQKQGISFISIFDTAFPRRLLTIPDPPLALFVKGQLPPPTVHTVSIIGARKNSYYGEKQTKILTEELVAKGFEIVSGMAKGIDGISQSTALSKGGNTYGILGCGVNVCYPPENAYLYRTIPLHGGLISEYLPDTAPSRNLFPARNRLISGLGDILIVTEAREKSGTFITVDMALEQGKEIFVLPGRMDDPLSIGCNRLISQGAHIILDKDSLIEEILSLSLPQSYTPLPPVESILQELLQTQKIAVQKEIPPSTPPKAVHGSVESDQPTAILNPIPLTALEKQLLFCLDYQPKSLDLLFQTLLSLPSAEETWTIPLVMQAMTSLCLYGLARQEQGGWYTKI